MKSFIYRNSSLGLLISCLLVLSHFSVFASNEYSGGVGTTENPYIIGTKTDLISLSQNSEDWNKHFVQISDIVFNSNSIDAEDWNGDGEINDLDTLGFSPIGQDLLPFRGSYKGQGHKISYLKINNASDLSQQPRIGLFGYIKNARIDSLSLLDASITFNSNNSTSYSFVGALVGMSDSLSIIADVHAKAVVTVTSSSADYCRIYASGLIGYNINKSVIKNCSSNSQVYVESFASSVCHGRLCVGSLLGYNEEGGELLSSYSEGNVEAHSSALTDLYVGGLVGINSKSETVASYSIAEASAYSTSDEEVCLNVGALVGRNDSYATLSSCYAKGNVSAYSSSYLSTTKGCIYAGGLVGRNRNNASINYSFFTGVVKVEASAFDTDCGAFLGNNDETSSCHDCFYEKKKSENYEGIGFDDNGQTVDALTFDAIANVNNSTYPSWAWQSEKGEGDDIKFPWFVNNSGFPLLYFHCLVRNCKVLDNGPLGCVFEGDVNDNGKIAEYGVRFSEINNSNWQYIVEESISEQLSVTMEDLSTEKYIAQAYFIVDEDTIFGDQLTFEVVPYSGGSGIEGDPYQISTAEDLIYLSQHSEYFGMNFKQINDIDFSSVQDWNGDGFVNMDDQSCFQPIGNEDSVFEGVYDGNDYVIDNLQINVIDSSKTLVYAGLFACTKGATIKGVNVQNGQVRLFSNSDSTYMYVGGIVGNHDDESEMLDCSYAGSITTSSDALKYSRIYVGGLAGNNNDKSRISRSFSTADISVEVENDELKGNLYVGNAVGRNDAYSQIDLCYAQGFVNVDVLSSQRLYLGGFVGRNSKSEINNCYSGAGVLVSATTSMIKDIGGFVGECSKASISSSYTSGAVRNYSESQLYLGGFVGFNTLSDISNCVYDQGAIGVSEAFGTDDNKQTVLAYTIAEFYAMDSLSVGNWFWAKDSIGNEDFPWKSNMLGRPFLYYQQAKISTLEITNDYHLILGVNNPYNSTIQAAGIRLRHPESTSWSIPAVSNAIDLGDSIEFIINDLVASSDNFVQGFVVIGGDTIYGEVLSVLQEYSGGTGSVEDPYQIKTAEDLVYLSQDYNHWNQYFVQVADIELSGVEIKPIGNAGYPFTGDYNGVGFSIKNLELESDQEAIGLFGYLEGASIDSISLLSAKIKSSNSRGLNVGLLVGKSVQSKVSYCSVFGTIDSYSNSTVSAGGIIGYASNTECTACCANGSLFAESLSSSVNAGGVIGYSSDGSCVKACYSTLEVSAFSFLYINVGGLVGRNYSSLLTDCYSTGLLLVKSSNASLKAGGLVGKNEEHSYISSCYTSVLLNFESSEEDNVGACVGKNSESFIEHCYYDSTSTLLDVGIAYDDNQQKVQAFSASDTVSYVLSLDTAWKWNDDRLLNESDINNPWLNDIQGRPSLFYQSLMFGAFSVSGNIQDNYLITGDIYSENYEDIQEKGFFYRSTKSLNTWDHQLVSQEKEQSVLSTTLDDLQEGLCYYARPYVVMGSDTLMGDVLMFAALMKPQCFISSAQYVYGEDPQIVSVSLVPDSLHSYIYYSKENENQWDSAVPTNAGTYDVRVKTDADDFSLALDTIYSDALVIYKAEGQIDWSLSDSSITIEKSDTGFILELATTTVSGSSITYTSSDVSILEIDKEGGLHINGIGNVTIKAVVAETENYKSAESSVSVEVVTNMFNQEFTEKNIKLFPNPLQKNSLLSVSLDQSYSNAQIEIYDISGSLVYSSCIMIDVQTIRLPITISPGVYSLKIKNDSGLLGVEHLLVKD